MRDGNPPCGWATTTSRTSIWSELTKELHTRSVRILAEHSWSEVNIRAVVETPQKPKSTTVDIPLAAEPLAPPPAAPEVQDGEKEEPTAKPEEDEEMQEEPSETKMTPGASSFSRCEMRTETQEATSVKDRVTMTSSTDMRTATFTDELVKRRMTGKTDTKSDDVLMPVEIEDSDLLNTVIILFNNETGEEANSWSL